MSLRIHCDLPACGATRSEQVSNHGWVYLEDHAPQITPMTVSLHPRELHFCSWTCVVAFGQYEVAP